jgi:hypothetical protein
MKEFIDFDDHDHRVIWAVLTLGVNGLLRLGELLPEATRHVRDEDFETKAPTLVELNLSRVKLIRSAKAAVCSSSRTRPPRARSLRWPTSFLSDPRAWVARP